MKYKVIVHHIYRIEREIDVKSHEEAMKYGEVLQNSELPDDAVRSDDFGLHEIVEDESGT